MKVAVTGGNGFVAGYMRKEFEKANMDAVFLARHGSNYHSIRGCTETDYSVASLCNIFHHCCVGGGAVNAIVHLAGPRIVAPDISFYSSFFDMTRNLYEAAAICGITNIVCASSISVYSGDIPYTEKCIPKPANAYGLSKVVVEHIGNIYSVSKRLKIKNLRFAHLYGANENNNYMLNKFLRQAYRHEQIVVNSRGVAHREMMYAKDAALAVIAALEQGSLSGTYNVGSGEALTNEEIAKTICIVMSPELHVRVKDEPEMIKSSYMDSSRIYRDFGYTARYTLKSALPEIYRDMQMAE